MSRPIRSPDFSDWRDIASLGEQLANVTSLTTQRDRIIAMTSRLVQGRVDVWLHENLFRLPDWHARRVFPSQPRIEGMRRALVRKKLYVKRANAKLGTKKTFAAVPIMDQGLSLGVLQVTRSNGPDFEKPELELLEGIASVVAVGLYASHRVEVERFRLGQLNLVGEVSAQIANVLNVDELAGRVTGLIQRTFNYYYVAIFTLQRGARRLRFRSSAGARRQGEAKMPLALEVELDQGLIGEAASSGERIMAPDVRTDLRFRFLPALPETRSEVVIPLKLEGQVLGVLDVQSDRRNAFHPNDLLLLQALADNVARAVEGARLYGDLRRRADQLTMVAEVSKSINSTLDLGQMMEEAANLIHSRFGYPHVYLFSVHPNRRLIEYEGGGGQRSSALKDYNISLDATPGIIPWVAREGQSVLANDVAKEPRYKPSSLPPKNTRSELCVPLLFNERVLGVLDIQSDRLNAFTDEDRVMFETVAGTIAASIRNADLYRSEQWRRRVADSFREVAGLLSKYVGVDQALEAILTELERNLPVEVSAIWLRNEDEFYLAAAHGVNPAAIERARRSSAEASQILEASMLSGEPVIRKASDPLWPSGEAAGFKSNYSSLAAPLRVSDQPVGIITLAHHAPGRYGHEAQGMAATFASYAAVAIENARLYDLAQEQAYVSAALLQVAQAVARLSDLNEILATIIRMIPILVGSTRTVLFHWDAARQVYLPLHRYGLGEEEKTAFINCSFESGAFPILDAARLRGETAVHLLRTPVSAEDWIKVRPAKENDNALRDGERLLIAIPLAIKSEFYGALILEETPDAKRFRVRRLEIIQGIAQQISLAIQDDRLQSEMVIRERLETEIELARQIQRTFFPEKLPEYEGWELAARWETARQVGGDFYDVIELPNHKLGLFIADVADKGMPAALFMALTRTLMRAAAIESASPGQAMQRVNELLMPDTKQGMFVTAVYGVLDCKSGEFTYANAGHNPPLWVHTGGHIDRLTRTGIALGVFESDIISERTIKLARGDSIFLYTDGLTEAFSPTGAMFGEARLMDTIQVAGSDHAETVLNAIGTSLNDFKEPLTFSDDLTMLMVRRK